MIVLFALIGALAVGIIAGLIYRGFVFVGDRRKLDILTHQINTEQRMSAMTHQALMDMRRAAADHFKYNRSA